MATIKIQGRRIEYRAEFAEQDVQKWVSRVEFPPAEKLNEGCWLWRGDKWQAGYGRIYAGEKNRHAHRVFWWVFFGVPPEDKHLHHVCGVRNCVNPWHLTPLDPSEHARGCHTPNSITAKNKLKTHCPKGHPFSGDNLELLRGGGRRCRQCGRDRAREYARRKRGEKYTELYGQPTIPVRTHCKSGHELTPENLMLVGKSRECRICYRKRALDYYYRQKGEQSHG